MGELGQETSALVGVAETLDWEKEEGDASSAHLEA